MTTKFSKTWLLAAVFCAACDDCDSTPPVTTTTPPSSCPAGRVDVDGNASNGCECVQISMQDEPDDDLIDSNCDGFDGVRAGAVYVATSGSDAASGSYREPKRTLAAALAEARTYTPTRPVYVADGVYPEGRLMLPSDARVYGGFTFDASSRQWTRARGARPRISGASPVFDSSGATGEALLYALEVTPAATSPAQPTAVALLIRDAKVVLDRVRVVVPSAANAAPTTDTPSYLCRMDVARHFGGLGGRGGLASDPLRHGLAGASGENSAPVGNGGAAGLGLPFNVPFSGQPAHVGNEGEVGRNGAPGARGLDAAQLGFAATPWFYGVGSDGAPGEHGGGGGGGGGGGAYAGYTTTLNGGYGGNGGVGGCGGQGGRGGAGGGSSIGVAVYGPSARVTLRGFTEIEVGAAGAGAFGGQGAYGGEGDEGQPGIAPGVSGRGGNGGRGGRGGPGGMGGSGADGVSYCIAVGGGAQPPETEAGASWCSGYQGTHSGEIYQ